MSAPVRARGVILLASSNSQIRRIAVRQANGVNAPGAQSGDMRDGDQISGRGERPRLRLR